MNLFDQEHASQLPALDPSLFFDLQEFFKQAESYLDEFSQQILKAPRVNGQDPLELNLTNTLVCLSDSEWKYLPLWAGGNDDGSGGVFNDDVPIAESGFSTAGPNVHTGSSIGSGSSRASSEFEMIDGEGGGSTYHTSTVVNDGYSDAVDRRRVYDADSVWGDVLANKGKNVASACYTVGGEDVSMDGADSCWEEIMTPGASSTDGDNESVVHVDKGKGKVAVNDDDEETFDDVFMAEGDEDEDDFDDDEEIDFDDEDDTDGASGYSFDEHAERMEIGSNGEYIAYKEDVDGMDALRP